MDQTMKRIIYCLLLLTISNITYSQGGFVYFLDSGSLQRNEVSDISYDPENNEIFLLGNHLDSNFNALKITKLDTFGFQLDSLIFYGDSITPFSIKDENNISISNKGSFVTYGDLLFSNNDQFILEFDKELNVLNFNILSENPNIETNLSRNNISINGNNYLFGIKQGSDLKSDIAIIKIDHDGIKDFEKLYAPEVDLNYRISTSVKVGDDKLTISGLLSDGAPINLSDPWITEYILIQIDTLGNITHEINSQTDTRDGSPSEVVHFINEAGEERLAFGSAELLVDENVNAIVNRIRYLVTDMEGNIYNSIILSQPNTPNNYLSFNRKIENGFLTSGQAEVGDVEGVWPVLGKMNEDGDTMWWSTYDINDRESLWDKVIVTGMDIMPSGSILICGNMTEFENEFASTIRPFIMKLDKNGCLEPDCRPIVNTVENKLDQIDISVTPNPGTDQVTISTSLHGDVHITDITGRTIWKQNINTSDTTIDTHNWNNGIYLITLLNKERSISQKWLKL